MAGIFKADDARGVHPTEIAEESVRRIGFASARFSNREHGAIGIVRWEQEWNLINWSNPFCRSEEVI